MRSEADWGGLNKGGMADVPNKWGPNFKAPVVAPTVELVVRSHFSKVSLWDYCGVRVHLNDPVCECVSNKKRYMKIGFCIHTHTHRKKHISLAH